MVIIEADIFTRRIKELLSDDDQIRMLYAYRKAKQENLSSDQLKLLRQIVESW